MQPKKLAEEAAGVMSMNQYSWLWPPIETETDIYARANELIGRAEGIFDAWFTYLRGAEVLQMAVKSGGKVEAMGDELEDGVKAGEDLVWAESRVFKTANHYDVTSTSEVVTLRWLYVQGPSAIPELKHLVPHGAHVVRQVLIGIRSVQIFGGIFGDRTVPCDGIDVATGFWMEPDNPDTPGFEDPFSGFFQPTFIERLNDGTPVFEDCDSEVAKIFPNGFLRPIEYDSPQELYDGIHAGLDELDKVFHAL